MSKSPAWRAKSIVTGDKGLGNMWVCHCPQERCVIILPISEEPTKCKHEDNVFRCDPPRGA